MISDAIALIKLVTDYYKDMDTYSAMFDGEGNFTSGDKEVDIIKHKSEIDNGRWFYEVKPLDDYVFINMPILPAYTDYASSSVDNLPDAKYFRYVSHPMAKFTEGGEKNLKVGFTVVGYRPSQLLEKFKSK